MNPVPRSGLLSPCYEHGMEALSSLSRYVLNWCGGGGVVSHEDPVLRTSDQGGRRNHRRAYRDALPHTTTWGLRSLTLQKCEA
jgi:hypothetical protein